MSGRCQCGHIAFEVEGVARDVHYCHCSMCRRAVGNAFATLAWFHAAQIRWRAAEPASYRSSPIARRGFCDRCGSPVYLAYDGSRQIALMVGLFDRPQSLVPTHHYGVEGRLPWVDIGAQLPAHPTAANPRPRD